MAKNYYKSNSEMIPTFITRGYTKVDENGNKNKNGKCVSVPSNVYRIEFAMHTGMTNHTLRKWIDNFFEAGLLKYDPKDSAYLIVKPYNGGG